MAYPLHSIAKVNSLKIKNRMLDHFDSFNKNLKIWQRLLTELFMKKLDPAF